MRCVVFGATGYIGGRIVPALQEAGHTVRAVARDPGKLAEVPWDAEVVRGDLGDAASVRAALDGQDVVYYLVHSLQQKDFVDRDRELATTLAEAAKELGVKRIVYLGGITPADEELSPHLASRHEVGEILLASGVPTVVLRAAIIIGSGSASFEMLRYLTERLPAMITPRWVHNRIQPIAVRDVLHYLTHAAELPAEVSRGFDIAGPDVLTYLEMMRGYAAVAKLPRRVIVPVPVLTPWLSAQWVNLVTPVPKGIAVPLIGSLVHEVVAANRDIAAHLPDPAGGLTPYERAIELALRRIRLADVPTRWSDAGAPSDPLPTDPDWSGGSGYVEERSLATTADPARLWAVIEAIGGERGWYSSSLAWSVRGWLDHLVGGVGLRRGRRDPHRLHAGEALDWWRVEAVERPRLLRLRAEMRLPGRNWLELSVTDGADGGAVFHQRVIFEPHGLAGHVYWKAIAPFHGIIFGAMARNLTEAAEHPSEADVEGVTT